MRPSTKLWLGGGGPYSPIEYGLGSIERLLYKVTLWSLNLIHKFKLNYLLIKPTKTICFHAMRPSKYQNNNTESLMGDPDFVYMLLDWAILFFIGRHLFLQCFKFGKAMYIICNKIRVICRKIRVGMEGGPIFHRGGVHIPWVESYRIWTPGSIFNGGPYSISHRHST